MYMQHMYISAGSRRSMKMYMYNLIISDLQQSPDLQFDPILTLIWPMMTVMAAAEVKPLITGKGMKSTNQPARNKKKKMALLKIWPGYHTMRCPMYAHDPDITVALFYTPVLLPVKSFQDPRHYYRNPPPSPPPQIFFLKVCVFSITINTSAQLFQHFANEMALQPDCEKQYTAAFMVKEISLFLFKPLVFTV